MPMRLRWLEDRQRMQFDERRAKVEEYDSCNPLMSCSRREECLVYKDKLPDYRLGVQPEEIDSNYGIKRCTLYYGMRFKHMNKTRKLASFNRHKLSCFRGMKFQVMGMYKERD
jgi:hypothetical protein